PARPQPSDWRDLVPESDGVLEDWCLTDDAVVTVHTVHAVASVTIRDKDTGVVRAPLPLPGLGVAGVTSRPQRGDDVWVTYGDFVTPGEVWHHTVSTGATELWARPPGVVDVAGIITEQLTYQSADGTDVRMFVIRQETAEPTGSHPTVLNGYGGF